MRILMISNHLGVQSGVQRYVQNLLLHLDTAKYRVTLFVGQCPPDQASTAPALEAHGVEILAVPDNKKDRIRALAAHLRTHKDYDIIHYHTASKIGAPVCGMMRVLCPRAKIVVHSHIVYPPMTLTWRAAHLVYQLFADYFLGCGVAAGRFVFGDHIDAKPNFSVACNAVDAGRFHPDAAARAATRAAWGITDTDRLAAILDSGAELWAFDAKPLYRLALEHGGIGSALRFDGKLAAYLLNPSASGYEVHSLAAEYGVHAAFACEAAPDAGVLAGLCDTLAAALDESGQRKLLDEMELPLARVLADMERIGFAIDADGIRAFGDSLRSELDGILNNIYTAVGYPFNVNSPKQLGEALFDKLGLPPRKTNARGYSTDAETLESLRPYSPVIDEILKYRTYAKLLSTYVDGLLNAEAADGRVHSTFIQTEARTGRISSTEPNLQNIPIRTELGSRLRGYFVAGEGETLVDADYSQIELRILAHITGDEHMQQAFLNGADIHRSTAAKIYHIPESEVTPQLRSASKAINFGIMYGKGAYSLSKDLGIPVKEADTFLKTYLDTFPKVDGYMKDCIAHAKDKGYVETLFGRRRALPELASSNFQVRASGERMARNTPIQGTAADIIKLAMVHVWQRLRDEKLQARLLLQVHDELIVEAPEAEIDEVKRILKEEMENVVHYSVPLTTEVGVGKTWLEAH